MFYNKCFVVKIIIMIFKIQDLLFSQTITTYNGANICKKKRRKKYKKICKQYLKKKYNEIRDFWEFRSKMQVLWNFIF